MAQSVAPPPSAETYSALGPMVVMPGADDLEIAFTRLISASREDVYAAFTDPELLTEWWGPLDYSVTVVETDPRPGGRYRLVLQAPDGTEYPVQGAYIQADPPDRIVMTDEAFELPQDWNDLQQEYRGEDDTPLRLILRVIFDEAPEGTALSIVSRFPQVDDPDDQLRAEVTQTWNDSLDRLERLLSRQP